MNITGWEWVAVALTCAPIPLIPVLVYQAYRLDVERWEAMCRSFGRDPVAERARLKAHRRTH